MKHLKYFGDFVNELKKNSLSEEDLVKKNAEDTGDDEETPAEGDEETSADGDEKKGEEEIDLDLDLDGGDEKKEEAPEGEEEESDSKKDDDEEGTPSEDSGKQ